MNLKYLFHSGKNSNLKFYILGYLRRMVPQAWYLKKISSKLSDISRRDDLEYIRDRVEYYNKLLGTTLLPNDVETLKDFDAKHQSAYYIDLYRTSRWFPKQLKCSFIPGDVVDIPEIPSVVKSRPILPGNDNSVILKLDSARHFVFLKDKINYHDKQNKIIFRGQAYNDHRRKFMEMYFNHPMVDAGVPEKHHYAELPIEWKKAPMTLYDHLKYKFIMAIEGKDVASNLKWVMSSNSVAVMPEPKFETWFMEGRLIPDYHYIRIKSDYSDLEERINYYIEHEDEVLQIIEHAHEYVKQFFDTDREKIIEILTLQKYFQITSQL
ncbi:MAG: glycosyl transferase family 90 [Prevotellaceae bacterium]|nr:glycosyl transferase family 90 [Prevotellaceae bacterium]